MARGFGGSPPLFVPVEIDDFTLIRGQARWNPRRHHLQPISVATPRSVRPQTYSRQQTGGKTWRGEAIREALTEMDHTTAASI